MQIGKACPLSIWKLNFDICRFINFDLFAVKNLIHEMENLKNKSLKRETIILPILYKGQSKQIGVMLSLFAVCHLLSQGKMTTNYNYNMTEKAI